MGRVVSELERARLAYEPRLPRLLRNGPGRIAVAEGGPTRAVRDVEAIAERFPRTFGRPTLELREGRGPERARPCNVGVVLSGGQAPGGHNVITGIFDALRDMDRESRLFGFVGGPRGIFERRHRELDAGIVAAYRNTGGFDMIGAGRDKVETAEQLAASRATCEALRLDGLVIVGGDDSNTNAATLAEYFLEQGAGTCVVGVPKTIDGDMKGGGVEASFGFDTATKVYAELVGNICRDAASAGKYWHFIRVMGRSASHVALECALQTQPNIALIAEEAREKNLTLEQIAEGVADVILRRRTAGRRHGVCLLPEGLIEFVPEMRRLIDELNAILQRLGPAEGRDEDRSETVRGELDGAGRSVFDRLPPRIRSQLLLDRDAHGNVQVSKIDTEALLVHLVERRLAGVRGDDQDKLQVQHHFFGYEGRCAAPSNFDADYAYGLGQVAAALIAFGRTGYICTLRDLAEPPGRWRPGAIPLTALMQMETRKGERTPVIGKALVNTDGEPFRTFAARREAWEVEDRYVFPGSIQYFGPDDVSGRTTLTLLLEHGRQDPRPAGPSVE